jgi:hypothetical protein
MAGPLRWRAERFADQCPDRVGREQFREQFERADFRRRGRGPWTPPLGLAFEFEAVDPRQFDRYPLAGGRIGGFQHGLLRPFVGQQQEGPGSAVGGGESPNGVAVPRPHDHPQAAGGSLARSAAASGQVAVDPSGREAVATPEGKRVDLGAASYELPGDSLRFRSGRALAEVVRRWGRWRRRRRGRGGRTPFAAGGAAARARIVLAGDAVAVPVEAVGVAGQQIFLRFGLAGEVGAVEIGGRGGTGELCAEPQRDQDNRAEQESQGLHRLPFDRTYEQD